MTEHDPRRYMNYGPADLNPQEDLPHGFLEFLGPSTDNSLPGSRIAIRRCNLGTDLNWYHCKQLSEESNHERRNTKFCR